MIKKLFSFILFPFLILSNVQAQTNPNFTSEYDLVNKELLNSLYGNCSSVGYECLEHFSISSYCPDCNSIEKFIYPFFYTSIPSKPNIGILK